MSATWTFKLPDVGEGIAEAELIEWRVVVGDVLREGDPLVEVMTDKATVELPSPVSGTVEWLGAEEGDLVPVGSELVRFAIDAASGETAGASPPGVSPTDPPPPGAPRPLPLAADPFAVGSGTNGQSSTSEDPAERVAANGPDAARGTAANDTLVTGTDVRPLAAPAVRRRARELGIDLRGVTGTGPEGRIGHEDLDRLLVRHEAGTPLAISDGIERIELRGLRRSIARHMQRASERIPHFTYVEEVDVTELQRLRPALDRQWAGGEAAAGRTGILAFLMRAVVLAVADHPEMNARFDDDAGVVERHRAVHLGVAVQTPQGLVVTVVRHAEARDVQGCANEVARLSESARSGTATLAELSGSTITISSLGVLGGVVSTPIINHPEVAIIGVNKIVERPVVRDGVVVTRQVMNLSSSFDHRVVDGWDAAQFVQRIRELLEHPALLFAAGRST